MGLSGLVAPDLGAMDAHGIGQGLLSEPFLLPEVGETCSKFHGSKTSSREGSHGIGKALGPIGGMVQT